MATEEVGNLAVKISMDQTGFQNGISGINRQLKVVQSEFQAAGSRIRDFGSSTEGLKLKADSLSRQLDLQRQKVKALEQAFQTSSEQKGKDAKATQELEIKLNKARTALGQMEDALAKTNKQLKTKGWSDLSKSLDDASKKMKSVGDGFSNVGKTLSTSVTLPLAGAGTAATKLAMDAVESENLFDVSMGDMAESARKWSEDISKSLGLNSYAVRQNVGTFNVMLTSMGQSKAAALEMSEGLTQLAYDMASFYNLKPEEAFEKLKSGISGETEPLKSLGILINDTQVKTYALTNGIIKQGQEMLDSQKIQARYALIMQSTSKAQGDLARTMDSPTNQLRTMKEQVTQIGIQFGQILIPMVQKLITAIKPLLDSFMKLTPAQQELIVKIGLIAAAIDPVILIIGKLITAVGAIAGAFSAASGAIATAGGFAAVATGPIGITIAAISAIAAGAFLVIKNWGPVSGFFKNLWNDVSSWTVTAWNNIKNFFTGIWDWLKSFFTNWGPEILAVTAPFIGIPLFIFQHWEQIKELLSGLWEGIKSAAKTAWNGIVNVILSVINPFIHTALNIWSSMKDGITSIMRGLKEVLNGIWTVIKNIFLGAVLLIIDLCTGNFTKLKEDASRIFENLKNALKQIWEGIKLIFTGSLKAIAGFWTTTWEGIKNATITIWNTITTAAVVAFDALKNGVTAICNDIKNGVVGIWITIVDFFKSLPKILYDLAVSMFTSMKKGVENTVASVKNAVVNGITTAVDWIKALPGQALEWGSDFINGFKKGILNAIDSLIGTIKNVAENIRSYLHFSTPDIGPLADYETWMPDFMAGLASGIEKSKGLVTNAVNGLAFDMNVNMRNGTSGIRNTVPMAASAGITVINHGTIVGRNGMDEFADIISKKIAGRYGLSTGGRW
ncbi:TP901 family phage tail tape measure protein [Ruminiclostridium sufflavum DSM 19573]|uniref:TP901 family phage tail tape measure protein n=1 Tax=Ruminiclostridium sufflavum DSM 19573 TaxID=1121337 RepID=A0A318XJG1_9FIRM|nr:hypothetical protein [Ruminiclostridium sufflavum]PYG84979.1 TP901 family phage tail tape measure protein [Ruminiclostridium sufflavum DSM 19573]